MKTATMTEIRAEVSQDVLFGEAPAAAARPDVRRDEQWRVETLLLCNWGGFGGINVIELHHDSVTGARREAGARLEVVDPRLELTSGSALGRRVALDLIQAGAQLGELRFEVVLLVLERVRRVDERGVVADRQLTALVLRAPLHGDEQAEEDCRDEQHEGPLAAARARGRRCDHGKKCEAWSAP